MIIHKILFKWSFLLTIVIQASSCKEEVNIPEVYTTTTSKITSTSVTTGGNIVNDGGSPITSRGVCWSTSQAPFKSNNKTIDGTGKGSYSSKIFGLIPNTFYYVCAYATNKGGTAYGDVVNFKTTVQIADYDGNIYNTVQIDTQLWLQENLKVIHYRNGDPIPNITDNTEWNFNSMRACCDYNNSPVNGEIYGKLYKWYVASDPRNLCPKGWHIPTDAEWTTLVTYLGGEKVAGGKLKETDTTHWQSPNPGATNETGFTALPGGYRDNLGTFMLMGVIGQWWSSTEDSPNWAHCFCMFYGKSAVTRNIEYKTSGQSVRCVED